MFPNRRSLRVQGPQGMWKTSCGKWSLRMGNMVGTQLGLGGVPKRVEEAVLHTICREGGSG
ncbi:hypothetical protein Goklo_008183 [Gossypium klotzschianum]|uniref:Uncharacterized protein n=1 Tax=Gossypium klotzschianum TaxID=34286 RepID=A0A7J8UYZ4_9ROSI|nr:hypothetical protein [Gossypium klotzschianum]